MCEPVTSTVTSCAWTGTAVLVKAPAPVMHASVVASFLHRSCTSASSHGKNGCNAQMQAECNQTRWSTKDGRQVRGAKRYTIGGARTLQPFICAERHAFCEALCAH